MITRVPFMMTMVLFIGACSGPGEPSSGEQEGGPFLRCAPTHDDGGKESFKLAPLVVKRDGYELEVRGIERGVVVLGLIFYLRGFAAAVYTHAFYNLLVFLR